MLYLTKRKSLTILFMSFFFIISCGLKVENVEREKIPITVLENSNILVNDWTVSCGVDPNSIQKISKYTYKYLPSKNFCSGGVFSQRSELSTQSIPSDVAGSFVFSSKISFTSQSNQRFIIFSIHDGRDGCAPPSSLYIAENGQLYVESDIKTGPGESCIRGRLGQPSRLKFKRDGSEQDLKILVEFDGQGGFQLSIWLDGQLEINGKYREPTIVKPVYANRHDGFFFKHGVYSNKEFNFEMISKDRTVTQIEVIN